MEKINGIDKIIWINLERSKERKLSMENMLKETLIPNCRIEAIDGLNKTRDEIEKLFNFKIKRRMLTMCEVCCTLSHIKAIKSLKDSSGDYFMICEDDVIFDNINYLDTDLKSIIKNAPKFDILMVYKNAIINEEVDYLNWKNELQQGKIYDGAVCYIISKNAVNKFNNNNTLNSISVSDRFLFENMNTIVYKYNICSTLNNDSTIHPHHIKSHKKAQEKQKELIKNNSNNYILCLT